MKVSHRAARSLTAGHPWVFRESLLRPLEGKEAGDLVQVCDEDGRPLGWGIVEPEGAIAARIVSRDEAFEWSDDDLRGRVEAAVAYREATLAPEIAGACRLVHGEGDGLPGLAVDRLGEFLLIYKYSRAAEAYLDRLVPILDERLSPAGIYMQDRVRGVVADERKPPAFHLRGKTAPPELEVEEDGLRYLVDVSAPVSPGLFLDLREGRRLAERLAKGRRVLNLFSFTGSFGLRAVRGGAARVVNVDSAARSHARCRQNLGASGLDPEACEALTGDAFKFLEKMRQRDELYDLVIVDPPPFSRVKNKVFSAMRDWEELMEATCRVVAPGGEILAISNAAKLDEGELLSALGRGAIMAEREIKMIGELGLPEDFPVPPAFGEGCYLKIKRLWVA
ncbi:MAG: class I SAM-dependent rRNA methyltransferase [Myxococcales bacterium]|nr:class I SAM-dependent rRNA methyltransferase [Myxococcales bacterium]MCB9712985.1 class I SAM-dependent rRNA methyltransferase [Myxococcales bacterium]